MAIQQTGVDHRGTVEYDMKLAGRRVRHAREDQGIRAEELAEMLTRRTPDDWSHDMVRNLESGRRRIDPPLLRVLSEELDRPADYFLYPDLYNAGASSANRRIPRYVAPEHIAPVIPIEMGRRTHRAKATSG